MTEKPEKLPTAPLHIESLLHPKYLAIQNLASRFQFISESLSSLTIDVYCTIDGQTISFTRTAHPRAIGDPFERGNSQLGNLTSDVDLVLSQFPADGEPSDYFKVHQRLSLNQPNHLQPSGSPFL